MKLLAGHDRLDHLGVNGLVLAFEAYTDGSQLEDEVLQGDPHLRCQIAHLNLRHARIASATPVGLVLPFRRIDSRWLWVLRPLRRIVAVSGLRRLAVRRRFAALTFLKGFAESRHEVGVSHR